MNREDNLCWFHGQLSRERAEQILREEGMSDGVFLVRNSNSSGGDYVLSVLHKGEVWHYQIRRHGEDAFFSIDDQTPIHGLDSLIEHYQKASHGLVTQLSAIVKRDPPPHDSRSHGRTNLLHRATKEGDFTVVSELLKCGYRNIDAKNQDGQTAVHLACRFANERLVQKLIDSGANVNCRDSDGNTPLHYACRNQSANIIKMLVQAKGNIQARNNGTGCVPLHDAARQGNMPAVRELLQMGAPHMPRSTYGELPVDFAKEGDHKDVLSFLENYKPPPATVYRFQWYHGTLDRYESNELLKQYVRNLECDNQENGEDIENISGVFLVRFSEKSCDYVLTLLFENQPKHFMIKNYLKHLYIDEGPYMPSLEHLIQHYMRFSDGLPINLRYPVPPKPKPPLPLFSTIPKAKRMKNALTSPEFDLHGITQSTDDITVSPNKSTPKRNMSIPTDDLMNTVGIVDKSTPDANRKNDKEKNNDILNFRSLKLKSPKKNIIIDGMKSLKKNKSKQKKEDPAKTPQQNEEIAQSLRNLSFSSDLRPAVQTPTPAVDALYNVPTNNQAVITVEVNASNDSITEDDVKNENVGQQQSVSPSQQIDRNDNNNSVTDNEKKDYFTESDFFTSKDKDAEEIYFIDAPMIQKVETLTQQPSTSTITYTAFKHVPYFPDSSQSPQTPTDNNNFVGQKFERLDSTISMTSTASERFFRQQSSIDSTNVTSPLPGQGGPIKSDLVRPNYFIPKICLELQDVLGEGEFGSVYRGIFNSLGKIDESSGQSQHIPVAIKTLHDEHCKQNRAEFLREASVMIKLSHHCIVKMIGISRGPPLMMVQELVALGSMLNYIVEHPEHIKANFELKIWASQIACGMNYLESHHFVHRDLAARNILLASKNQAKISDFGLSRALCTDNNYYQASQGGKWPIKWYAPESYNFGTFSHASDVWSFGVTLWEMFSYGRAPYGEMKGVDVIQLVEIGQRLTKPPLCPDNVYQIMENCWNYNPKDRPTFRHLTQFFANDPDYQNLIELINNEHIS